MNINMFCHTKGHKTSTTENHILSKISLSHLKLTHSLSLPLTPLSLSHLLPPSTHPIVFFFSTLSPLLSFSTRRLKSLFITLFLSRSLPMDPFPLALFSHVAIKAMPSLPPLTPLLRSHLPFDFFLSWGSTNPRLSRQP
jgi:hypothetical protein